MLIRKGKTAQLPEELKEQLNLLIDSVNDYAIFILDKKGFILTWNPGAEYIKQYKAEEIIGKHFSLFFTQDARDRNEPQLGLDRALKNGYDEEEAWRVRKDGSQFWAHIATIALFKNANELVGFGKVVQDFT